MFITFEGPEGSGKSTQLELLADALRADGREVVTTREPGGVPAAEEIRGIVLHHSLTTEAEALLFLAARAEHAETLIRPALARGAVVLCDRFTESTLAYQGYGLGLDLEKLRTLCDFAAGGLVPDLTLLLDLPPEAGFRRRFQGAAQEQLHLEMDLPPARASAAAAPGAEAVNKMENRDAAFHRRVREGYLKEAARHPERIYRVDAEGTVAVVHRRLLEVVRLRLGEKP